MPAAGLSRFGGKPMAKTILPGRLTRSLSTAFIVTLLCTALGWISGCARAPSPIAKSAERTVNGAPALGHPDLAARAFLHSDQEPPTAYRAWGFVLIGLRPTTDAQRDRLQAICLAYLGLPTVAELKTSPGEIMPTFWLMKSRQAAIQAESWIASRKLNRACESMIDDYDYGRSTKLLAHLDRETGPSSDYRSQQGPVLIAYSRTNGSSGSNGLVFDASGIGDAYATEVIQVWMRHVVKDPTVWDNGIHKERAILIADTYLDRLAQPAIATVQLLASWFGPGN